jgi:hypothetical protein
LRVQLSLFFLRPLALSLCFLVIVNAFEHQLHHTHIHAHTHTHTYTHIHTHTYTHTHTRTHRPHR